MLRTALILLVTCLALGGAFTLYLSTQPPTQLAGRPDAHPPAPPIPAATGAAPYRDGGAGDLKQYNKVTGRISSIMSWNSFTRHKDGTTTVTAPVMSFYVGDGRRLMIVGETGQIDDFHAPAMTAMTAKEPVGMPDRGTLQHVTIYLYPTWDDKAQPNIILTTENLAFDNATFRIATAAYTDEHGNSIAADQVPVHVTGDYLFDGRGLTVQWNDRDNRLELLEVAHGEQLTILHPKDVFGTGGAGASAAPVGSGSAADGAKKPSGGGQITDEASAAPVKSEPMLASAEVKPAAHPAHPAKPAKATKPPQPPYLARFFENVVVTQGVETKVTGNTMDVGFLLKESAGHATTRPGKESAAAAAPVAPAAVPKVAASANAQGRAPGFGPSNASPAPAPAPAPTPLPPVASVAGNEPVVIRWTGPLRITPAPFPLDLAPGTSMVTFWGEPVIARHTDVAQLQTVETRAASIVYYTADGSASLRPSPVVPKVLITRFDDSIGHRPTMRVIAEDFDFVGRNQEAIFSGPGEAHMPIGADTTKTMDTSWQESAKIFMVPAGHGQSAVSRAVLRGDVNVEHPQLSLQSQQLELRSAPPEMSARSAAGVAEPPGAPGASSTPATGTNGPLAQVIATDSVNCRLTDSAGKKQTIDCQKLDVRMGRHGDDTYPRQVFADGDVHAFDADQACDAGHIELSLAPSDKKSAHSPASDEPGQGVTLRSMYASDHVKLHGKADQLATCDELLVDGNPGQGGRVELIAHDGMATVTDRQNVISGPTIIMNNATQQDTIIGPGTLHIVHQDSPSATPSSPSAKPANPMDVIWSDRAVVNGPANTIDAYGKVEITQVAQDKSVDTAHSPHLHIDLQKKPLAAKTPATQPALVAGPSMDIFKNKQAKSVTLDQGAEIASTLHDPGTGALLRDMLLKAPTVVYTLGQSPGQETLLVPTAGQMLVRDYRTAGAGNAAATGAAQSAADDQHTMKGLTAFAWKKSLTYTAADHQARMLGDVHVRHLDNDQAVPADLFANIVTAHFLAAAKPKNASSPADNSFAGPMQLQSLHAEDNLLITHGDAKVTGTSLDFDPATHELTIHGTAANPVVESSIAGASTTQALTATWNTQTWNIDFKDVLGREKTK